MGDLVVAPQRPKERISYIIHYSQLVVHPGGRELYYKIRLHFYWSVLAVGGYATVRNSSNCTWNWIKLRRHDTELQTFPGEVPLTSVCIAIVVERTCRPPRNKYLRVIINGFRKMTKISPTKGITAAKMANCFTNCLMSIYGPSEELVSDNGR